MDGASLYVAGIADAVGTNDYRSSECAAATRIRRLRGLRAHARLGLSFGATALRGRCCASNPPGDLIVRQLRVGRTDTSPDPDAVRVPRRPISRWWSAASVPSAITDFLPFAAARPLYGQRHRAGRDHFLRVACATMQCPAERISRPRSRLIPARVPARSTVMTLMPSPRPQQAIPRNHDHRPKSPPAERR